jgi:uncharacterized FAD-dependent dehydrogenase
MLPDALRSALFGLTLMSCVGCADALRTPRQLLEPSAAAVADTRAATRGTVISVGADAPSQALPAAIALASRDSTITRIVLPDAVTRIELARLVVFRGTQDLVIEGRDVEVVVAGCGGCLALASQGAARLRLRGVRVSGATAVGNAAEP